MRVSKSALTKPIAGSESCDQLVLKETTTYIWKKDRLPDF